MFKLAISQQGEGRHDGVCVHTCISPSRTLDSPPEYTSPLQTQTREEMKNKLNSYT